jgi:ABC-type nitrate/sulfonate/bicarbonate transport system substrate-binding protein
MMDARVRVAGVPEHFNLPWHLALESGVFESRGIRLEWTEVPEGTGRMAEMLKTGETDLAVILTEGLVKAASAGVPALIVQQFIQTPLLWGLHVGSGSPFREERELQGTVAAISRDGSGSHLMAYLHAKKQGWDPQFLLFKVVDTLEGAVEALTSGDADYFMWERFTTQPLVDKGVFRRVGVFPTPWPCFVIAGTRRFVSGNESLVKEVLAAVNGVTVGFKQIPGIDRTLATHYRQKPADIQKWLSLTEWSQEQMKDKTIDYVIEVLDHLNLLSNTVKGAELLWQG